MTPKLKENPREWQKLILTAVVVFSAGCGLLWRRGAISTGSLAVAIILLGVVLVLCWLRPHWFRPTYRTVMTTSFYVGQVTGRVLLAIFFMAVLTPLALALRLFGKDLLRLRRDTKVESYWRPGKIGQNFDREF